MSAVASRDRGGLSSEAEMNARVAAVAERARAQGTARAHAPVRTRRVKPSPTASGLVLPERTAAAVQAFRDRLLTLVRDAGPAGITSAHLGQALRANNNRIRRTAAYWRNEGAIVQRGVRPGPGAAGRGGKPSGVLIAAEHA